MKLPMLPRETAILRVSLLLLALPFAVFAKTADAKTPEELVAEYVAATHAEGPTSVVRFLHPEEIARFRAKVEPGIRAALSGARSRRALTGLTDPENPTELRKFADDAEFLQAFITWIRAQNTQTSTTLGNAEVTSLGHVEEGELSHVVLRVRKSGDQSADEIHLLSTKQFEGEPKLLLTPELERMMLPFARGR